MFVNVLVALTGIYILIAVVVEARALLHRLQLEVALYAQGLPAPLRIGLVQSSYPAAWGAVDEVVIASLGL